MPDVRSILSVGIDVGTTTSQLVFSRLVLADTAHAGQIPRIGISDKSILYQSPIIFTPLLDSETIDIARLMAFIHREYASAGIEASQVDTGAVIITGETAKKQNAEEILQAIGGMAGDFVVTVAGPSVESMIAGRGSGAAQYSQRYYCRVANVDIGGGSSNVALFHSGKLQAAAAMNFGGRILEIDPATSRITHVAGPAKTILQDINLQLGIGDLPMLSDLRRFTDRMADLTVELLDGKRSPLAEKIYLTPPATVSSRGAALMISGGIGYYFYQPVPLTSLMDVIVHGDIGPLLADSLRNHPAIRSYETAVPAETLRATVIGASTQTVALSGSTIWAEKDILPLRNVPVVRPVLPPDLSQDAGSLAQAFLEAVRRWDVDPAHDSFAIALVSDRSLDFSSLTQLARGLVTFANQALPRQCALVVIIKRDYAQALGQTVKSMAPSQPLLVIDQVGLEEGDNIDVGLPMMDGRVVAVSVKTLVFSN